MHSNVNYSCSTNYSLVNNDECNKSYLDYTVRLPHGIDGSMVCAIDTNTTRMEHTCPVKSGGPLLLSSKSGDSVIAITGFGSPLGSRVPCVYTAIYAFLDWIEEHVWPTLQSVQEWKGHVAKQNGYKYQRLIYRHWCLNVRWNIFRIYLRDIINCVSLFYATVFPYRILCTKHKEQPT